MAIIIRTHIIHTRLLWTCGVDAISTTASGGARTSMLAIHVAFFVLWSFSFGLDVMSYLILRNVHSGTCFSFGVKIH